MDLYALLNEIIVVKPFKLSSDCFYAEAKNRLGSDEEKVIFELMKNVSSLGTKITKEGISFYPFMVWDGKRTFSLEDMTYNDYLILEKVELDKIPLNLRARIADILWTQRKNYKAAVVAAESYLALFKLWFSEDEWVGTLDSIKRAIYISAQIKKTEIYEDACKLIYDIVIDLNGMDDGFLSLRLMNIIIDQKYGNLNQLISVADSIISIHNDNITKVEQAYDIKVNCYNRLKNVEEARHANVSLAEYYVDFAERLLNKHMQDAMRAGHFLKKAILLFRNNKESQRGEEVHRRLIEIQKEIPKQMTPISIKVDVEKYKKIIETNMEGLTFEESVIRLTQFIVFPSKEKTKGKVFDDYRNSPVLHMVGKSVVNASGQTVLTLEPLDIHDTKILDMYIHQKMLEEQNMLGDIWLQYMFFYVRNKFSFEMDDLAFLTENNFIVPAGRERIIRSAIFMVLKGQYYEAMHILAPQVENLFRNIAKEVGGLTVTLDDDGTSKEKVLSSIFDLPELQDCYDNDIIFMFKGLLNEQAGANIRNEIAHGIINEARASTGVCLFFAAAVIKLISMTSLKVYKIYKNSERLHKMHGFDKLEN